MLSRLGRWLIAAGYDTAIARPDQTDEQLLAQAAAEQRLLITRDSGLTGPMVIQLHSNNLQECIAELSQRVHINWLLAPFTRCLVCNEPLTTLVPGERWQCPVCQRFYWEGGHTRRMREQLTRWSNGP
jgi:uncharacterized protein with PIN domain